MADLNLHPHPKGTLIQAVSLEAMDFIVERYKMMADPIVDDIGVILVKHMAGKAGLTITDLTVEA